MALRIHTNILSQAAQTHLDDVSSRIARHFSRLSSGLRIVEAADDAAGLSVAEHMKAQHRSLAAAGRNVQEALSLLRTAEGALGEVNGILIRMRELAVAALNGTANAQDVDVMNAEYGALAKELNRITTKSEYNDIRLFNKSTTIQIQVGTDAHEKLDIDLVGLSAIGQIAELFDLVNPVGLDMTLSVLDSFHSIVANVRGSFGTLQNRFESVQRSLETYRESMIAAESRIRDVDLAAESAELVKDQIIQLAGTSVLVNANLQPLLALDLLGPPQPSQPF